MSRSKHTEAQMIAALKQVEQVVFGAGDGREEFPPRKDADAARGSGFDLHFLFVGIAVAFGDLDALFAEARVDGSQQVFRNRSFG